MSFLTNPLVAAALIGGFCYLAQPLLEKLLTKGEQFVNTTIDQSKFFQAHPSLGSGLKTLTHIVDTTIMAVAQKTVNDLKAAGAFNKTAADAAKRDALAGIAVLLSQQTRDQVMKDLGYTLPGELDAFIQQFLESRLAFLKSAGVLQSPSQSPASTSPVAAVAQAAASALGVDVPLAKAPGAA